MSDRVDAVFIPGRAKGDDSSLLELAAKLYHDFRTGVICIPGTPGGATHTGQNVSTTYQGPRAWTERLNVLEVHENIVETDPNFPVHTKGDTHAFITRCRERRWTSAAIITQPHQILRTMLALVKSMEECSYRLKVIPLCPTDVDWVTPVFGSQGAEELSRDEHLLLEWKRVLEQQEKRWLATFEQLREYLKTF